MKRTVIELECDVCGSGGSDVATHTVALDKEGGEVEICSACRSEYLDPVLQKVPQKRRSPRRSTVG